MEVQPDLGHRPGVEAPYLPTIKAIVMHIPGINLSGRSGDEFMELKRLYSRAFTLPLPAPVENWSAMIACTF
jgi:hypothetical protein